MSNEPTHILVPIDWLKDKIKDCLEEYVKPENEVHQGQIAMEHITYEIILKKFEKVNLNKLLSSI